MDMDDQEAVASAFERSCAQMRLTLNRTKARVLSATGGTVEMEARTEDTCCYWQTFVRLCSGNSEQVRNELTLCGASTRTTSRQGSCSAPSG